MESRRKTILEVYQGPLLDKLEKAVVLLSQMAIDHGLDSDRVDMIVTIEAAFQGVENSARMTYKVTLNRDPPTQLVLPMIVVEESPPEIVEPRTSWERLGDLPV